MKPSQLAVISNTALVLRLHVHELHVLIIHSKKFPPLARRQKQNERRYKTQKFPNTKISQSTIYLDCENKRPPIIIVSLLVLQRVEVHSTLGSMVLLWRHKTVSMHTHIVLTCMFLAFTENRKDTLGLKQYIVPVCATADLEIKFQF